MTWPSGAERRLAALSAIGGAWRGGHAAGDRGVPGARGRADVPDVPRPAAAVRQTESAD